MKILVNTFLMVFILCFFTLAFSQEQTQTEQPPWFFYWPTEDPDNFNYSGLGNSTFSGGSNLERRSNIEVNKQDEPRQSDVRTSNPVDVSTAEDNTNAVSRPPSSVTMHKWVDDQGVTHVTNNINSIPVKYRDQLNMN
jgi:hypothetical protein